MTKSKDKNGNEDIETAFVGIVRNRRNFAYRIFYLYGETGMKKHEVDLYEKFCRRCENFFACPWLSISNEPCLEMTAFEEKEDEPDGYGKQGEKTV